MIKNKKILFLGNSYRFFNHFHQSLIQELRDAGNIVHVAADDKGKTENCDMYHALPMVRNPLALTNIKSYKMLRQIILENDYDIIHAHTPLGGVLSRMLKMFNGKKIKPIIYTAHGLHFYKGSSITSWLVYYPIEKLLSYKTEKLILINKEDMALAKAKKFKAQEIIYIPGVGIDLTRYTKNDHKQVASLREEFGYSDKDIVLSFVGELNKNKNQKLLIETIEILIQKNSHYKLLLVGDGVLMDTYKDLVVSKNLQEYVNFLGYSKRVEDIVKITDIALSSSIREGLPVNLMEQSAAGNPIVATNCRGNRDIVIENKTGYLIDFNADEYAEKIQKLVEDKDLYQEFSRSSKEFAKRFDFHQINSQYIDVYESVIKNEKN